MSTKKSEEEQRRVFTIPEVARIFGINRNLAYELARTGQFPILRLGKRIVVPKIALDQMLSNAGVTKTDEEANREFEE